MEQDLRKLWQKLYATAQSGKIEVQLTAQKECAQQARITHKRHASGILNAIF